MKTILFLYSLLFTQICFAQLNCKTSNDSEKNSIKKCLHQNGTVSTIETWNKDKRSGNLKAFDKNGKELFNYGLRTFAGHSSVFLIYYKNGQVFKAEYTSAPDGGIQYYHEISKYNENGERTEFIDISRPDGFEHLTLPNQKEKIETKPIVKTEKKEIKQPFLNSYEINNRTNKKIVLDVYNKKSNEKNNIKQLVIPAKQSILLDSIRTEKLVALEDMYEIKINAEKTKKSNTFDFIYEKPVFVSNTSKTIVHIIKK